MEFFHSLPYRVRLDDGTTRRRNHHLRGSVSLVDVYHSAGRVDDQGAFGRVNRKLEKKGRDIRVEVYEGTHYVHFAKWKHLNESLQTRRNEAARRSNVSGIVFCRDNGIRYDRFLSWLLFGSNADREMAVKRYLVLYGPERM